MTDEYVFQPIKNFYLPISLNKHLYEEFFEAEKRYEAEEALSIGKSRLYQVLDKLNENDIKVIDNTIEIDIRDDSFIAIGDIIVEESIVDYKMVLESEWRIIEEDELTGDNS